MKSYAPFLFALLTFFLVHASPVFGQATETKVKKIPFHGKLQAVDVSSNTLTLSGKSARVFHLTPTTKITDGSGAASTLSAAIVGEDVGGSYSKDAAGTMTLFSVRLGAKAGSKESSKEAPVAATSAPAASASTPAASAPASAPAASSAPPPATAQPSTAAKVKKQSFSGKVVSIDAAANTLVVHGRSDQTFTVTTLTKFTGAASGLSDVTAGAKVSGSYTKSADGSVLTVSTLKVGK
jgi:hypothetical protein